MAATAEPTVIGMAAQTVPMAYSCRSTTGSVRFIALSRRQQRLTVPYGVTRQRPDGVPVQVVLARTLVELPEKTLPEGVGVTCLPERGPLVHRGRGGSVGDGDHLDLAVLVQGAVHGGADDVRPVREGVDDHSGTWSGGTSAQPLGRGPEKEDAVLPAEVSLMGQGAQQVVGGGEGKTGLPGELLHAAPRPDGCPQPP